MSLALFLATTLSAILLHGCRALTHLSYTSHRSSLLITLNSFITIFEINFIHGHSQGPSCIQESRNHKFRKYLEKYPTFNKWGKLFKIFVIKKGISGAIARTLTAPFERITILRQTKNPHYEGLSIPKILVKMAKQEGFLSYFKGNGANICRIFPYSAIELFTFELFKHVLSRNVSQLEGKSSSLYFIAGTMAGMTASTFVNKMCYKLMM
jgi:Mitochondrial carrier protein.